MTFIIFERFINVILRCTNTGWHTACQIASDNEFILDCEYRLKKELNKFAVKNRLLVIDLPILVDCFSAQATLTSPENEARNRM